MTYNTPEAWDAALTELARRFYRETISAAKDGNIGMESLWSRALLAALTPPEATT